MNAWTTAIALAGGLVAAAPPPPPAHLVVDLAPGPEDGGPVGLVPIGDRVLMVVREFEPGSDAFYPAAHTNHLWITDGTAEGTADSLLPDELSVYQITETDDDLAFVSTCEGPETVDNGYCQFVFKSLWRTDGTRAGTYPLVSPQGQDAGGHEGGTVVPGVWVEELGLYFQTGGSTEVDGATFWVSDGTLEGTYAPASPEPGFFAMDLWTAFGGQAYFRAEVLRPPRTRWTLAWTDGTTDGLVLLEDFLDPPDDRLFERNLRQIWPGKSRMFLVFSTPSAWELWSFDGTPDGLRHLADLGDLGDLYNSVVWRPQIRGNTFGLVLSEITPDPALPDEARLWLSDGTPAGTRSLPPPPGTRHRNGAWFQGFRMIGGRAYFGLDDGIHGSEPWVSDGTVEGTRMIHDFCPGPCDGALFRVAEPLFDDVLLTIEGDQPWVYDPSSGDLRRLGAFCPGECEVTLSSNPEEIGDRVYFRASDPARETELWTSDGTIAGTVPLSSFTAASPFIYQPFIGESAPTPAAATRRNLFFGARETGLGHELWTVDLPSPETGDPPLPPGNPLTSPELPGYEVAVRILPDSGAPVAGRAEAVCIPETLCVSGAVPGRSELFVRIVGPRPNGFLWPTLVKFTTSTVEVWIRQTATDVVRYYRLEGASPGTDELPGLFDRTGFLPE